MNDNADKIESNVPAEEWQRVEVPRPEHVKVVMIAESPSPHLLPVYRVSRTFDDASARLMIFASAEPGRLLVRIDNFLKELGDSQRDEKMAKLNEIFRIGHLIYLSKEPIDERSERGRFTPTSVRDEVDGLLDQGVHVIVTLGEAARSWMRNNFSTEGLTLVQLPVPSNHISDWFPSFMERMHRERGADTLGIRDSMAVQIDKLVWALSDL